MVRRGFLLPVLGLPVALVLPVMPAASTTASDALAVASAVPTAVVSVVTNPTLRYGSRGPAVLALQQRLIALRYMDVGVADGIFGSGTLHGVLAFQKVQGIARDGIVGPVTWARLAAPYRPAPRYRLTTASLEVDLVHQVVYYVRYGAVQRIADASTGSGAWYYSRGVWARAITPTGRFRIYWRVNAWQNSPLGWMYRPNYFYRGYALHGSTSVPAYPASHGCVRVTVPTMDRLWPLLWIGMPVAVYR